MWRRPEAAALEPPDPAMVEDLLATLKRQREGIPEPGARWGWKAPRTIFVLPAVHHLFGDAFTIQLVRDGRDMAYSQNQNQLEALGPVLLGDLDPDSSPAVRSITLWSRLNLAASNYGRRFMGGRHLVARYEELCAEPEPGVARILAHIGVEDDGAIVARARELVQPSPGIGRWRARNAGDVEAVCAAGAEGLGEFGYL